MGRKTYRVGPGSRLANHLFTAIAARGRGPASLRVATMTGRRSGLPQQVPLHIIDFADQRWAVAIYGPRAWVQNVRAHPDITVRRGGSEERVQLQEVDAVTGGPVLEHYVRTIPHVRPYLDIGEHPSPSTWRRLAVTHPVFRLLPPPP